MNFHKVEIISTKTAETAKGATRLQTPLYVTYSHIVTYSLATLMVYKALKVSVGRDFVCGAREVVILQKRVMRNTYNDTSRASYLVESIMIYTCIPSKFMTLF